MDYLVRSRHNVSLGQNQENLPLPVVGGAARILAPSHSSFLINKTAGRDEAFLIGTHNWILL